MWEVVCMLDDQVLIAITHFKRNQFGNFVHQADPTVLPARSTHSSGGTAYDLRLLVGLPLLTLTQPSHECRQCAQWVSSIFQTGGPPETYHLFMKRSPYRSTLTRRPTRNRQTDHPLAIRWHSCRIFWLDGKVLQGTADLLWIFPFFEVLSSTSFPLHYFRWFPLPLPHDHSPWSTASYPAHFQCCVVFSTLH